MSPGEQGAEMLMTCRTKIFVRFETECCEETLVWVLISDVRYPMIVVDDMPSALP